MIHLFKHQSGKLKGKFDIALIVKGKYIVGSNQGYNRKGGAINAIVAIMDNVFYESDADPEMVMQDDTVSPPLTFTVNDKKELTRYLTKPSRPYTPKYKK